MAQRRRAGGVQELELMWVDTMLVSCSGAGAKCVNLDLKAFRRSTNRDGVCLSESGVLESTTDI